MKMESVSRRTVCWGLGGFAASFHLRALDQQFNGGRLSPPDEREKPALLERPASGIGSIRLVDIAIRQQAFVYKRTPQGNLAAYVFYPPDWNVRDHRPVCGFFFGGGWRMGTPAQFIPEAEYFASRGMVCVSFDYRKIKKLDEAPEICVEDAKAAIRWLRAHARELGVDPRRVVASGGSAGGQLAAATAFLSAFDDCVEPSISCIPDAMVLFNPELDLTGEGFKDETGRSMDRELSPLYSLRKGGPPMILFYGTADPMLKQGETAVEESRKLGNVCELYIAEGQPHAFFNLQPWLSLTVIQANEFLRGLGYLKGSPTLRSPDTTVALTKYSDG